MVHRSSTFVSSALLNVASVWDIYLDDIRQFDAQRARLVSKLYATHPNIEIPDEYRGPYEVDPSIKAFAETAAMLKKSDEN
jgi:hypothetical protein